ncbi:MAG TPA: DUF4760 domain-containing protein [Thermoplasmata archaeon]|nr:DUF4760 domain-containing protein [Thermoplasmata archaeon]
MVSVSDVVTWLAAVSSLAVIVGVGFVVLQLRQNARLLEATLRQQRSDVTLSILERITDESFPRRRSEMHRILHHFAETDWKDAFGSPEGFEVRNFAQIYDLIAVMAKHQFIDLALLSDIMQGVIIRDWEVFAPYAKRIRAEYGFSRAYANFEWLAGEIQHRLGLVVVPPSGAAVGPSASSAPPPR